MNLYKGVRIMRYGLILSILCISQVLYAQNDIVKEMDSLGTILEQPDSITKDSSTIIPKPKVIPAPKAKKSVDVKKVVPQEKEKVASTSIATAIEKKDSTKEEDTLIIATVTTDTATFDSGIKEKVESSVTDGANEKLEQISDLVSGDNIFWSIVFLLFGYVVVKVFTYILNGLAERSPSYRIAFKGAIPIIKIVIWVIIISLIIVVVFRPSITTMLAFSASIGVAVGFASQDILKNVFAGIVILFDRPFVSGDKIEVDKYYGEVVAIGLRSTRIVTPDDSLVSVPNSVMMSGSVSNANSGELNCQVVAEIFLPNEVDTKLIRAIATEAASVSKYVYLGKPISILFFHEINQNGSYLKMKVKAYVMDTRDEFKFKSDMTELIIHELVKGGIL